jgi:hypothetical protein
MTIETLLGLMIRYILLKTSNNDIDDLDVQLDNTPQLPLVICLQSTILNELCQFCNGTYLYVTELPNEYEFI